MKLTKEVLKKYLYNNWDVTLKQIIEDLNIDQKEIPKLKKLLEELEEEKWIEGAYCIQDKVIE